MGKPLTPSLTVTENGLVRRYRELPLKGEVLVRVGQVVRADEIVAKSESPGELKILRLPERLGIDPIAVMRGLKVQQGESVRRGQMLCEHKGLFGLFKSRYFSPSSGVIEVVQGATGHLALRGEAVPVDVNAYVAGRVVEVLPEKGAIIEARGVLVQGIFGVGGERQGRLSVLPLNTDEMITESILIGRDLKDAILVGGSSITTDALQLAVTNGAIGVITGSIDDETLRQYLGYDLGLAITGDEAVPATLIVTEGFGSLAMSHRTYDLLKKYDGRQASLNGATQIRAGAVRPELIIPDTTGEEAYATPSVDTEITVADDSLLRELRLGSRVRLIRFPYFGLCGLVDEIPDKLQRLDTGAEARVVRVKLETVGEDGIITVPRANVELL